ncbi:MAG: YjbQ family protein, partial [Planctomycetaceae bacterium]
MFKQQELEIATTGRGTFDLTERIEAAIRSSGIRTGLCHVFVRHTSA